MSTFGPAYEETLDGERIRQQHVRIRELMLDGEWRTLSEIGASLDYPEASVSAQLRHLRKPEFGEYLVEKRRRIGGLWEYQVKEKPRFEFAGNQGEFFGAQHSPLAGH